MRRIISSGASSVGRTSAPAAVTTATSTTTTTNSIHNKHSRRHYRIMPHVDNEIQELAEMNRQGRWFAPAANYCEPMRNCELLCDMLNSREARRTGQWPERAISRDLSQTYAKDGVVQEPGEAYKVKPIQFTILGIDGHPYHIRMPCAPDITLSDVIDQSGVADGWKPNQFAVCGAGPDGGTVFHEAGCLINIDIDTLDKMLPPTRWEHQQLQFYRDNDRPDVTYTSRFACCVKITEELDGAVVAMKNHINKSLRAKSMGFGEDDNYATISLHKSRKLEPWAPMVEEPTARDFPITPGLLWARSWQDIYKHKYKDYVRHDGHHSHPETNYASYT